MKILIVLAVIVGLWLLLRPKRATGGAMSPSEARELLGIGPDADAAAIRAAHLRLIQRVHPDAGGSAALASRVNAARDLLVRKLDGGQPR